MAKVPTPAALDCCARLGQLLSNLPSPYPDRPAYDRALEPVMALIGQEGGSFSSNWNGTKLRLHGFSASSTSGLAEACRNWRTQVTLKAMQANMAGAA